MCIRDRVYAALRRYKIEAGKTEKDTEVYRYKKLRLHPDSRKAEIGGQELPLTCLLYTSCGVRTAYVNVWEEIFVHACKG